MLFQIIEENGVKKIQALTADTGAGAPVGSIIVVCSNILPSGYLGLGVQYDITNYPALYQVLGTDTTPTASALGLPTLSSGQYAIKATSGLTENQQENVLNTINENLSYSTEEHPTGKKWIDGKDIYERTFVYENKQIAVAQYNTIDSQFPISFAQVKKAESCIVATDMTIGLNWVIEGTEFKVYETMTGRTGTVIFTLEYTKTTDN